MLIGALGCGGQLFRPAGRPSGFNHQSDLTAHQVYEGGLFCCAVTRPTHKFQIGQTVFLTPSPGLKILEGAYIVTKKLPERQVHATTMFFPHFVGELFGHAGISWAVRFGTFKELKS
jgi:hypothetical protein